MVAAAVTATSPWWRRRRPSAIEAVAPAVAPWVALAGLPLAVASAAAHRRVSAVLALAIGGAGVAMRRWVRGTDVDRPPHDVARAEVVRIGHFNVWYENAHPDAAAHTLAGVDVDVLVLSELTPALARQLDTADTTIGLPHRIERTRPRASGMAIWSRHPLVELEHRRTRHARIRATIAHPTGPVVVDAIHAQSPIAHPITWARDLAVLAADAAPVEPAVMVGDFNAAWTHQRFRRVVSRGWQHAHRRLGVGTRNSWRVDRRFVPAFVRLDHALVNVELEILAVEDVDLPGSDHRGFVVTVRRRAG